MSEQSDRSLGSSTGSTAPQASVYPGTRGVVNRRPTASEIAGSCFDRLTKRALRRRTAGILTRTACAPRWISVPRGPCPHGRGRFCYTLLAICLGYAGYGCAPAPPRLATPYLIATRYDVEPCLVGLDRASAHREIRRGFQTLAELGFDGVILCHVEDSERLALLDLAHETGLRAGVPDRGLEYFVLTGALPPGARRPADLTQRLDKGVVRHPAYAALTIGGGRSRRAARRRGTVCELLRDRNLPCLPIEGPDNNHREKGDGQAARGDRGQNDANRLVTIDAGAVLLGGHASALERLLAQYHSGLSSGRTGGLMLDRFRGPGGKPNGLSSPDEPLTPAQLAAIEALNDRARHWGPRLRALAARPIKNTKTDSLNVELTVLSRETRRYVLVFNPSPERYARGEVVLPGSIDGVAAARAVEVPPSANQSAGRVVDAWRGQLVLPIALRPGDAALFEIF